MAWFQSKLTVKQSPRLNWDLSRNRGVSRSGWNPLVGLRVSVIDESLSDDKVSIFVEPAAPGTGMICLMTFTPMIILLPVLYPIAVSSSSAKAYIFSKNATTGRIDLFHRVKPFRGDEIRVIYEDVTYFGIKFVRDESFENLYTSTFIITFKDGQISLPNGECFVLSYHKELNEIIESVNALIARSLEGRDDLNSTIYPMLSTGHPGEYGAIPFAASTFLDSEIHELAYCTTTENNRTSSNPHSQSGSNVLDNMSAGVVICDQSFPLGGAQQGDIIQEAVLIPEPNNPDRYHREATDFPNIPY